MNLQRASLSALVRGEKQRYRTERAVEMKQSGREFCPSPGENDFEGEIEKRIFRFLLLIIESSWSEDNDKLVAKFELLCYVG